jgi:hypothetical protein
MAGIKFNRAQKKCAKNKGLSGLGGNDNGHKGPYARYHATEIRA